MKKRSFIILLLLGVIAVGLYKYIYKNHRDIASEASAFIVSSHQLSTEFIQDAITAETKYLNKTIEITGVISDVEQHSLTLNDKVFCQFAEQLSAIKTDEYLKIKGRVIGYDDLLEQVKLDQCHIIN